MVDLGELLSHLPAHREIKKLISWLKRHDDYFQPEQDSLDQALLATRYPEELQPFLERVEEAHGRDMVKTLISKNIKKMLKFHGKQDYFTYLHAVIKHYDVPLKKRHRFKLRLKMGLHKKVKPKA